MKVFFFIRPLLLIFLITPQSYASEVPTLCSSAIASGEFAPQGIDISTISKTIRPGDDFFSYVNQGWVDRTVIPDGNWDYGQTTVLIGLVEAQVKNLITANPSSSPHGSPAQQVVDAYSSFNDIHRIESQGLDLIEQDLKGILSSATAEDIAIWMANPTSSSLFAINLFPAEGRLKVHLDQQNLTQPMLGLWGDTYNSNDEASIAKRAAYQTYIADLFKKARVAKAESRAAQVVALEIRISANQWNLERLRDRRANYHPMKVDELIRYAPGFPWRTFLKTRGVGQVTEIVLGTDTAVQAQSKLFSSTPIDEWRSWLAFHWLQNQINVLPDTFRQSNWDFYNQGRSLPTRDEVALRLVNASLGQQVGRLYAERYVSPKARAGAEELIHYLRRAFEERLVQTTWMDKSTRAEALAKLANLKFKIGYPTIWRNFSRLNIQRDDAVGNLRRIHQADWEYQRQRLDPKFLDEPWYQTPQTVDASYSVLMNAIELPGAFLQPPYFNADADPAVNFGAIGAIIGHEMGHAFDDQGVIYDSRGRLRNWWSDASTQEFRSRTKGLISQFEAFSPYDGVHVNGQRTIGENIADLSGVSLAYRAYQLFLKDHPCADSKSRDGFTGNQRFFLAWAQVWRYKAPESAIRHVLKYSYYPPTPYRVNGVMQNMDAWYNAFKVTPDDKLYVPSEKRIRIW
jgi:putative endopeptidase